MNKQSRKTVLLFCAIMSLLLASCTDSLAPVYAGASVQIVKAEKVSELENAFKRYNYDLETLQNGIPPLIFLSFPQELADVYSTEKKKRLFFQTLLPMVLLANAEIRRERQTLLKLDELTRIEDAILSTSNYHLLKTLAKRYGVRLTEQNPRATLDRLLKRIDIIPTDLVLAQAANESAYGTSRFSQLANNLFGEWTFTPGTGIVPEERPEGETYEIRRFNSLLDSVRAYQKNLNTHPAYRPFRELRAAARSAGQKLNGKELANGLLQYSTRREDYIKDLQILIQSNNLDHYASATLRKS